MLRGFGTSSYRADDVEAARDRYAELLGIEPYLIRPGQGHPHHLEMLASLKGQ
jgi:hypothetical protein